MIKKIAVLSDDLGAPTSLVLAREVIVYARLAAEWQEEERYSLRDLISDSPKSMRLLSEKLADKLGSLKIILGSDINGAQYMALNRSGFLICESEGISDEFFDELFLQLAADEDVQKIEKVLSGRADDSENTIGSKGQTNREAPASGGLAAPSEDPARPGCYFIDLSKAQQANPLLSSKKILRPFLFHTPFIELEVLCDHEPPWLEYELPGMGLEMTGKKTSNELYNVKITHKSCCD